jgi:radical SAM protein with 4Fe4S-binding SPASM domain
MCPRTYAMTRDLGHMDIGLFREIVDQLRPAWQKASLHALPMVRLLHFGEPMVYRHFKESIEHCHRRGYTVFTSTNPSVWTDRGIEEVLDTQLDVLMVMFDGMDDATSIAIRGKAASFTRGEANLRKIASRKVARGLSKPIIMVDMIRQPRNQHQWALFETYWKDMPGVDTVYLDYYSTFSGTVDQINALGAELATRDPDQASELARRQYLAQFPCVYPWHSVSVTWDGRVVPCCRDVNASTVLGDLRSRSLEAIWNDEPIRRLRQEFASRKVVTPLCASCTECSLEVGLPDHYPVARLKRWAARKFSGQEARSAAGRLRDHAAAK